ncbi:MAG: PQQ-binding-like beta-propeller repeat protein [Paracoccaceae bacterium]|nr:PQQ-binding-like beta-propeller repeat protein [Paracoccaceae bacterium]
MKRTRIVGILAGVALVAACAPKPLILKGPRFDPRTPLDQVMAKDAVPPGPDLGKARPIRLSAPVVNADWAQRNGGPQHHMTQPALGATLTEVWEASIGKPDDQRHAISTTPVVAAGRVYTLDSRATVVATSTSGATLWSRDLTPPGDSPDTVSGGGIAYGAGKLFVTSDFGELVALDPATGAVIWRQRFKAPVTGTPTVEGNVVYVVARDSSGWAIDAATGKIRWQLDGVQSPNGMTGGAGPAISGGFVLLPFPSGQLVGALQPGGTQVWASSVVGDRLGQGYGLMADITGDPVVVGSRIYVGNATGRVMALTSSTGEQIWSADYGVVSPVWPEGDSIFLVSDQAQLVRLDAATGAEVWKTPMPLYVPVKKEKRRRDIYAYYGPIMAGNRLIVTSSDGQIRSFDPVSGKLISTVPMGAGAASAAVVAGRTLYVVGEDGKLRAFR